MAFFSKGKKYIFTAVPLVTFYSQYKRGYEKELQRCRKREEESGFCSHSSYFLFFSRKKNHSVTEEEKESSHSLFALFCREEQKTFVGKVFLQTELIAFFKPRLRVSLLLLLPFLAFHLPSQKRAKTSWPCLDKMLTAIYGMEEV